MTSLENFGYKSSKMNHGYYSVGNQVFEQKIPALIAGTQSNTHPTWHFHDDVFGRVNWQVEPTESILELYARRARQIREKYDYIVIMYSAGSDSQTVLDSFLHNNLKVDEVVVTWPASLRNAYQPNRLDTRYENTFSEWDFAIEPKLKQLARTHPNIKITINDWAENIDRVKVDEGYIANRSINFAPYSMVRWNASAVDRALSKSSRNAVVWGLDKPRICIDQGAYRFYFLDMVAMVSVPSNHWEQSECFFWSQDCPELLVKQAHLLVKYFEANPELKQHIQWPNIKRSYYEPAVRKVIYPNYDLTTFQAQKSTSLNLGADILLYPLGDQVIQYLRGVTEENFKYLHTVIDKKYFQDYYQLTGFISGMWPIKYIN